MLLGDVIKEYRSKEKITLRDFSKMTGLSVAYINQLEKNLNPRTNREIVPSIDTFYKVAQAMGITLEDLSQLVDQNQPVALSYVSDQSCIYDDDKDISQRNAADDTGLIDNSPNTQLVSERLKEIMAVRNLKQSDIVNSVQYYIKKNNLNVKISKSSISQYVSGKVVPKQDKIFILADALDVNPAWLFGMDSAKMESDFPKHQNLSWEIQQEPLSKPIIDVAELMMREDARTQRFIYELVRDYLDCNEFERGRLNTAANLKADRTLADKVKTMKKPEDITREKTDIKEAK